MRHGIVGVESDDFQLRMQILQALVGIAHDAAFARHGEHFRIVHPIAKSDAVFQAVAHRFRYRFQRMTFRHAARHDLQTGKRREANVDAIAPAGDAHGGLLNPVVLLLDAQEALDLDEAPLRIECYDISNTIGDVAREYGYPINLEFGGHGVGHSMHGDPHVPNDGRAHHGYKLREGLVIAIEPWFLKTTDEIYQDPKDGWTLKSEDGSRGAHSEHTIAITENGPVILTVRD